jgi:Domain of unknown function (DUF4389)
MSAYYAPPAGASAKAADPQTPTPVPFTFGESAPQARLTVAFRLLAAIPQLIVLAVLGVAAYVVTIIGWFAALFTGRLPAFAADFLTGYLRWMARVYAYAFLLTDVYPPFSLADADYPVRVAVTPGPLNRLAVLFRFFLMIPCWIVTTVISYGAFTIVQLVSWLIVLISGRMPNALHEALAATLRYQLRTVAFGLMLTSAYPGGLFGEPKYSLSQWPLVLSGGARKLLGVFIVLGVLLAVGGGVVDGVVLSHTGHSAAAANNQVLADAVPATTAIGNYSSNLTACKGSLSCVTALDRKVGATLGTFAQQLPAIAMPSAKAEAADKAMASAVSRTAAIFDRLGTATTPTQYDKLAGAAGVQASINQLNQAYINLGNALTS